MDSCFLKFGFPLSLRMNRTTSKANSRQGGIGLWPIPDIRTFLPKSSGSLPVISTIPGEEGGNRLNEHRLTSGKMDPKTIPTVSPEPAGGVDVHPVVQEARNTLFCPFHDKFHAVIFKGVKNISDTL